MNKKKDNTSLHNLSTYSNNKLPGPQGEGEEVKTMMDYTNYYNMLDTTFNYEGGDPLDEINQNYDEIEEDQEMWRFLTAVQEGGDK